MFKKLKVELVIFKPVRFLPDSWPFVALSDCLRLVQSVGVLRLLSVHVWIQCRSRWGGFLWWRLRCCRAQVHSVSPVYTIFPVYYVGSLAVLSLHGASSPFRSPSFLVLVVNWLTRGESLQVSGTFVVVTLNGKTALGFFRHNLFLSWGALGSCRR